MQILDNILFSLLTALIAFAFAFAMFTVVAGTVGWG